MLTLPPITPPTGYARPENEVHTEFPKWVHVAGASSVIAESAEHEAAILVGVPAPVAPVVEAVAPAPIPVLVGENDEMTMLKQIAADKGIHLDGRWKLNKVRAAVEAASPKADKG